MPETSEGGFDRSKQQLLLLSSWYFILAALLYYFALDILLLIGIGLALWYAHDFIRKYTKETVDPSGKYVFITGCDSGFGLESAKAIRDLGFDVIAGCYADNSAGAIELKSRPWVKKIEVVILDVSNEASVLACAKEVKDICQDQGLWAVINNAGINCTGPTELVSMEMFHRCVEINLMGAVRVTKSVLPLIRQAEGRIINVTSERAFNPWRGSAPYCISKFGLEAFSQCLRKEMVDFKVKVITIAPGHFGGATGIITERINQEHQEKLLQAHANLSIQDQNHSYNIETLSSYCERMQRESEKSCTNPQPVVNAYVDAVQNKDPQRCYMIHGFKRQWADPQIIMARCRPFIPEKIIPYVEKCILAILG